MAELGRHAHHPADVFALHLALDDRANAVDVATDQVSAEAVSQAQSLFQIDRVADLARTQGGTGEGFVGDVDGEVLGVKLDDGQARPGHRDGITQGHIAKIEAASVDGQAHGVAAPG